MTCQILYQQPHCTQVHDCDYALSVTLCHEGKLTNQHHISDMGAAILHFVGMHCTSVGAARMV